MTLLRLFHNKQSGYSETMNTFNKNSGFTLVEVVVAMALFILVISITGTSFSIILGQTSRLQRSEESNIEGIIGLEMFRHDLQQAGFGLFTEVPPTDYSEAAVSPAQAFNDSGGTSPNFHVPRPVAFGDNLLTADIGDVAEGSKYYNILNGTDYLAIKATTVGTSKTAQRWSYLKFSGTTITPNIWPSGAENFKTDDYMVLLRRVFSNPPRISIERDTTGDYYFKHGSATFAHYSSQGSAVFTMYGIYNGGSVPRIPFNRSDYFVARPKEAARVPPVCAPNTGVLYKTTVNQADGKLTYMPIVDCVADMQVVLGWDINLDGMVDTWSNADGTAVSGTGSTSDVSGALSQANNDINSQSTLNIRNCLKMVKVYLIVQDGKKDTSYASPDEVPIGDSGEKSLIRASGGSNASQAVFLPSANMKNYRWKEYRIIVRPRNLQANQ